MSDKLATIYIWITLFVFTGAVAVMLVTGNAKQMETTETTERIQYTEQAETEEMQAVFYLEDQSLPENSLRLTLPAQTKEQTVSVENNPMDKIIRIRVAKQAEETVTEDYFLAHPVAVNAHVEGVEFTEDETAVCMTLQFQTMMEWEMKFETQANQNYMNLQLVRPGDKYEKMIVLDAGHGGSDAGFYIIGEDESTKLSEKELTHAVVKKAGALLEKAGVHVYYTRMGDENPEEERRVALANEVQADMLISVHADFSEDSSLYGMRTIYNETYFIPEFASADLAYLLLEKVAASTNEKAIGFEAGTDESQVIRQAMVPVAQLNIGYLSNRQEQKLLSREDYIERIAQGICDAVLEGYKEMEK